MRNKDDSTKTDHLTACAAAAGASARLEFFAGDLLTEGDYDAAFSGADAVVHTAAVVAIQSKNPERDIVEPSMKGTRNMLASADRSGTVMRVVHTSSVAAIQSYDNGPEYVFTEKDEATWSTVARGDPYGYAKLGAERLVRDHVAAGGKTYDCCLINPVVVFGPCMTKVRERCESTAPAHFAFAKCVVSSPLQQPLTLLWAAQAHTKASPSFLRDFLFGNAKPDAWISVVDVREVSKAHLLALQKPEAAGQRFIIARDDSAARLSSLATATVKALPEYNIKPRMTPSWQVSLFLNWHWLGAALVAGGVGGIVAWTRASILPSSASGVIGAVLLGILYRFAPKPYLKKVLQTEIRFDAEKSRAELGLAYRPLEETLRDTAKSMVQEGWVKLKQRKGKGDPAGAAAAEETQPLKSGAS